MSLFKLYLISKAIIKPTYYLYHKHTYEQLLFERMKELCAKKITMSGIYIVERQIFGGYFWYAHSLIPFGQSLIITNNETNYRRHIRVGTQNGNFFGKRYFLPYSFDSRYFSEKNMIPIEAWPTYFLKYNSWPTSEKIDKNIFKLYHSHTS